MTFCFMVWLSVSHLVPVHCLLEKTSIYCKFNLTRILHRRVNDQRYFCKTLSYWSKIYRIVSWRYGVTYPVIWNIFQRNPLNINVKDNLLNCDTEYLLMKKSISAWYMILRFAFSFFFYLLFLFSFFLVIFFPINYFVCCVCFLLSSIFSICGKMVILFEKIPNFQI